MENYSVPKLQLIGEYFFFFNVTLGIIIHVFVTLKLHYTSELNLEK